MIIQIDTREKAHAIKGIVKEFDKRGITYFSSKLYMGDYADIEKGLKYVIDRKQNIRELATNCTKEQKRLEAEMDKLKDIGARMTFLITQNRIGNKPIMCLEDLILWEAPKGQGTINGEIVYRKIRRWERIYPVDFQFCSKAEAGRRIIELLEANNE